MSSQEKPSEPRTMHPLPQPFEDYTFVGPEPLGVGGAGQVWLGRNSAGIEVAIKRLQLNDTLGQLELAALEALKNIKHAHLLPFIYFKTRPVANSTHEELLIVMEKGEGSLAQLKGWETIDLDVLLKYIEEAAEGLDCLHHKYAYVHRDIKPGNLLFVGGSVKVADFGLAKALTHNVVTHSRVAMSTPYAPPEWLESPGTVSPNSDQYSLAVSYVELRTGRHPFHDHLKKGEFVLQHAIKEGSYELSGLGDMERYAVRRALAKKPEHRYETCQAFVNAVRNALIEDDVDSINQFDDAPESQPSQSPEHIQLNDESSAKGPTMIAIKDLNFGHSDGNAFGDRGEQALLNRFFVKDDDVARVCIPQISFLVGEKGTGKTVCAEFLSGEEGKSAYGVLGKKISIQANDYVAIREATKSHQFPESADAEVWKTVLLVLLVDYLRTAIPEDQWTVELRTASAFIDRKFSGAHLSVYWTLHHLVTEARDAASLVAELGKQVFSGSSILSCIPFLQNFFLSAITKTTTSANIIVFIDGIDVRPETMDYEGFIKVVAALVNAVFFLNDTIRRTAPNARSKLVLLVRPDILDKAGMQNLNNKMRDNAVMLDWQTPYREYRHSKLFRLADQMLASQQHDQASSKMGGWWWDQYFPYKVYNNRARKDTDNAFIEFLRNSFYRPRDIVTYLEEMRKSKVNRGQGAETKFLYADFDDALVRKNYSNYLLGEVKDGLLFHHPSADFDQFVKFFQSYLRPNMVGRNYDFDYKIFLKAYDQFRMYLDSNKLSPGVIFRSADEFLQFLYELNIICYLERAPDQQLPLMHWCFKERSYANIRPKVRSQQNYRIHYGIAQALKQA